MKPARGCFTRGEDCTRCHGRNTLPGVIRNCRENRMEALAYGASLALWQAKLVEQADAVVVPSEFARERLRELGAPLPWERVHVLAPPLRAFAETSQAANGKHALVVSRLAPEKGVDVAIEACRRAHKPLVVAGDGPELARLRAQAAGGEVTFTGHVQDEHLAALRREAALALGRDIWHGSGGGDGRRGARGGERRGEAGGVGWRGGFGWGGSRATR